MRIQFPACSRAWNVLVGIIMSNSFLYAKVTIFRSKHVNYTLFMQKWINSPCRYRYLWYLCTTILYVGL